MGKRVYATKPNKSSKRQKTTKGPVRETGIVSKRTSSLGKLGKYLPFPVTKNYTFQYDSNLVSVAPATSTIQLLVNANSVYDPDANISAYFGNKQPLNYSKLLSATGPYKVSKVNSWDMEYTIVNKSTSSIGVWVISAAFLAADWDSTSEASNFPGAQHYVIAGTGSSENIKTVKSNGCLDDVVGYKQDINLSAAYNALPSTQLVCGLLIYSADATVVTFDISARFRQRALLSEYDGN